MSWLSLFVPNPANLFILLTAMGLVLAWRWTRLGLIVATVGGACLYLASTSSCRIPVQLRHGSCRSHTEAAPPIAARRDLSCLDDTDAASSTRWDR